MNVLFLIFNRPEETRRVFEEIKKAKPARLFIAADGPRDHRPEDKNSCKKTREISKLIDWPCEVKTLFRDENLGCKKAVSSGITWFFSQVEEGIILEDDCLPDQSFFLFAEAMLERYKDEQKIMHISGSNFQFGNIRGDGDYFFANSAHIWGWATWKRAWDKYDIEMTDLEETISSGKIQDVLKDKKTSAFWTSLFRHIKYKKVDTWDASWAYTLIKNSGLSINPNKNLVENIGFGAEATHMDRKTIKMLQKSEFLDVLNLKHPSVIAADGEADIFEMKNIYSKTWYEKAASKIRGFIGKRK